MAGVITIALLWGFSLKPKPSSPDPFSDDTLVVEVPLWMQGADKPWARLSSLDWMESRGEKIPGFDSLPWAPQIPDPRSDVTRIVLMVGYDGTLLQRGHWTAKVDLPTGAQIDRSILPPGFTWVSAPSNVPNGMGRSGSVIVIDGNVDVLGQSTSGSVILLDVAGIHGMTVSRSDTKVVVRPPSVAMTPYSPQDPPGQEHFGNNPVNVVEQAVFKGAGDVTWSSLPAASSLDSGVNIGGQLKSFPPSDVATWAYPMFDDKPVAPPIITGTDEHAVDNDGTRLFWSGILFGVAGAAVITSLQIFVTGVAHPKTWFAGVKHVATRLRR